MSLEGGGAEKVLSTLVRNFNHDFEVVLVTFYKKGRYLEELLSMPRLKYYCLNADSGNTLAFACRLRKVIKEERPDRILSFLYYPNIITCLAAMFTRVPFIVSERSNHRKYLTRSLKHKAWRFLLGRAYSNARWIVPVSAESRDAIISDFRVKGDKVVTIHNGISFSAIDEMKEEAVTEMDLEPGNTYILAVGSISAAKNHALLVDSFRIVHDRHPGSRLIILGKGDLEGDIRRRISSLGLDNYIHLPGYCENPYKFMARAACYVLSSDWEGFPNSLLEALYVNGHVVSTDCPTGPGEILTNNEDGILCEPGNIQDLAAAIERMCFDEELRSKVYAGSRKTITNFDESVMIDGYRKLLDEIN